MIRRRSRFHRTTDFQKAFLNEALAYLIGLAGWNDAWTNCSKVIDSGAL